MKGFRKSPWIWVLVVFFATGYVAALVYSIVKGIKGDWNYLYITGGITLFLIAAALYMAHIIKDVYKDIDESESNH